MKPLHCLRNELAKHDLLLLKLEGVDDKELLELKREIETSKDLLLACLAKGAQEAKSRLAHIQKQQADVLGKFAHLSSLFKHLGAIDDDRELRVDEKKILSEVLRGAKQPEKLSENRVATLKMLVRRFATNPEDPPLLTTSEISARGIENASAAMTSLRLYLAYRSETFFIESQKRRGYRLRRKKTYSVVASDPHGATGYNASDEVTAGDLQQRQSSGDA